MVFKLYDNHKKQKGKTPSPFKIIGMMGTCCMLPLIIVGILPILNLSVSGNFLLSSIFSLICPIMMLVIMLMMINSEKKQNCCGENQDDKNEIR